MGFKEWLEAFNTRLPTIRQQAEPVSDDGSWMKHNDDFEVGDRRAYRQCKMTGGRDCDSLYSRYRTDIEVYYYNLWQGAPQSKSNWVGEQPWYVTKVLEAHFNRLGNEFQNNITGTGNQMQVMSTVMSIINRHIQAERPDMIMTAAGSGESRNRLYQRLKNMYQASTRYRFDVSNMVEIHPLHKEGLIGVPIILATKEAYDLVKMIDQQKKSML